MTARTQMIISLMMLSIILVAGCAPSGAEAVPPTALPAPTLRSGWETHSASADPGQCGYAIDHPSDMDVSGQGMYNWLLRSTVEGPDGPLPNFLYVSVIPDGFKSDEPGAIYNYDPGETQTLLNMQVGESKALREVVSIAPWFTYTRLPDRTVANQAAQTYENAQPWEFPPGTKEIRYYLQGNGCTYLVGGYLSTVGAGQPGAISEELFDEIIATFRLAP